MFSSKISEQSRVKLYDLLSKKIVKSGKYVLKEINMFGMNNYVFIDKKKLK